MQTPGKLTGIAVIQLLSGLANLFVMWWVASFLVGSVCGIASGVVTLGACPIGGLCGFLSWALIPLGLVEVIAGIVGLANPKGGATLMRYVAFAELLGGLAGGLGAFVAGGISLFLMSDEGVQRYLADGSR